MSNDKPDSLEAWEAFRGDPYVRRSATKKVPLLEYLDKLEATAKAAEVIDHAWKPSAMAEYGRMTQPKATLALIAKLREAVDLLRQSTTIAAYPGVGDAPINRFQDEVIEWASIEVPE